MKADGLEANIAALIGALKKFEIRLLSPPCITARRGGCVIQKFCEATEADAAGVVFLLRQSENHPGLAISGCCAAFYWSLGHPSLR